MLCSPVPLSYSHALHPPPLSPGRGPNCKVRGKNRSLSDAKLLELQRLGAQSIGTKDPARLRGLTFEQAQLIIELELIQQHLEQLEVEIIQIVEHAREGTILTSIPGIGPSQAAAIIASIGTIANFERASQLKSYFGWAPSVSQPGYTLDCSDDGSPI